MPRAKRFKTAERATIYHCVTRTVNGEFLLDDVAKEVLRKQLHQLSAFCGVELLTYAIMSNHFHVLIRVPAKEAISDAELLRRYKILYPKPTKYATAQLEVLEKTLAENGPAAEALRKQWQARMGDVSEFMKSVKQRFSVWYNRSHGRYGPLWADRFTSVIVEGNGHCGLQMMAAYIDLNPVRAGLVDDPKDYRWSGYGEAVATGGAMVEGLRQVLTDAAGDWSEADVLGAYRLGLLGKGTMVKRDGSGAVVSGEAYALAQRQEGKLTVAERLRLRMKWLTHGAVLGSRQFVEEHLNAYRLMNGRREQIPPRRFARDTATSWPESLFALRGGRAG